MTLRRPLVPLVLALGALAFAAQATVNFRSETIELRGFESFGAEFESDRLRFSGRGNPAEIEARVSGLVLTGRTGQGTAARLQGRYVLESARMEGDARLRARARAPQTGFADFRTERIDYAGNATEGRATFPGAFTLDTEVGGEQAVEGGVAMRYRRRLNFTGSSGEFTLDPTLAGVESGLRTGSVAGPVTFSLRSEETRGPAAAETTTVTGRADALRFDLTREPRTVTASGNVTVQGSGPVASGELAAETVVLTLDANLNVTRIDVTGSPARTRLREEPAPSRRAGS